jgi:hypothetical protein
MSWNNLVSLDCLNVKSLSWKVCNSKPNSSTFDFIKILTQIINHFSKAHENLLKNLIYAKMVKVLQ